MKPTQLLLYCTVTIVVLAVVVSNAKPAVADAVNVNSAVVDVDGEATPAIHDAYTLEATLHAPSGDKREAGIQQAVRCTASHTLPTQSPNQSPADSCVPGCSGARRVQ